MRLSARPERRRSNGDIQTPRATGCPQWPIAAAALLLTACVAKVHTPYRPDPAAAPEATGSFVTDPRFTYPDIRAAITERTAEDEDLDGFDVREITLPSLGDNGQPDNLVTARYYRSRAEGRKRLILVLPIWGSYTYPSDEISLGLADHGAGATNVLKVIGSKPVFDWDALAGAADRKTLVEVTARMTDRVRANTIDVRRLIDWAIASGDNDPERIGIIGFSHGALIAALVAVQEPRIAAAAIVMGGAHPHQILATCPSKRNRPVLAMLQPRLGLTRTAYANLIEPLYRPYDVANYPGRADGSRVLIVEARFDDCVPETARDDLWLALGRPERISILDSHQGAFLAMTPLALNWLRTGIYEFFDRALDLRDPPAPL